jgi:uncharacterized membrane protein YgdD (TMEM256/DUF423 family)
MPLPRLCLALAALEGLLAVIVGAVGAHGTTDPHMKDALRTASDFALFHALAAYAAVFLAGTGAGLARWAGWGFVVGGGMFAGSIYLLALTPMRWPGPVTPLGGLVLMIAWLLMIAAALLPKRTQDQLP